MTKDTALPEPMTPADCDLRGMEWMPLYGGRLFGSDFDAHATDAEWRAALQLWWAAWNQVPAASLPDDDVALCRLAGFGRDVKAWRKVKERALYGFAKCNDGRLYHKALVGFANESWQRRLKDRERKARFRADKERREAQGGTRTERGHDMEPMGDGTADEMRRDEMRRDATLKENIPSVSNSAPSGASQSAKSKLIPDDYEPSAEDRAVLLKEMPWLEPMWDKRVAEFRDWCIANATRTFNPAATFRGFMRQTRQPRAAGSFGTPAPHTVRDDNWAWKVAKWREDKFWQPTWGPEPGKPGCFVPREFLQ